MSFKIAYNELVEALSSKNGTKTQFLTTMRKRAFENTVGKSELTGYQRSSIKPTLCDSNVHVAKGLIDCMVFSTLFQLYHSSGQTCPSFLGVSFDKYQNNILSKL